jgi:hypothetical protein
MSIDISYILKSRIFLFFVGVSIGIGIFSIYDTYTDKLHFERYSRVSDSLRAVISIKEEQYLELKKSGSIIDKELVIEKSKIVNIHPTEFIRPEIVNSDSAYVFLLKFIGDR